MANDTTDNTLSGGLLVVLGILVAAGLGYLFFNGNFSGGKHEGDTTVSVTTPSPESAEPAAGGSSTESTSSTTTTTTTPSGASQ